MIKTNCNLLVIFGATGDLTRRKLFPALNDIISSKKLPKNTYLLGCGRKKTDNNIFNGLDTSLKNESTYLKIDPNFYDDFINLKNKIESYNLKFNIVNVIFYLSTPPQAYINIINKIAKANLNNESSGFRRLVIEKPFGKDFESAKEINNLLINKFNENQIYRIDHYLGKETVQNILVTRFSNTIFNSLWKNKHISHIEITAAESIGIENRGEYYDKAGAIRDMFQNHLLELLCLISMEIPKSNTSDMIRDEKLKVLKKIKKINTKTDIIRGQYIESEINGRKFSSYRKNKGVNKVSNTETFFACKLFIDNKRWRDIPFFIRTGKRLPTKVTEIVVHFKNDNSFFKENKSSNNVLILRLQPDEGVLLKFDIKKPGDKTKILNKNLEFHYKSLTNEQIMNAYERLILDVFIGDTMLFARSDFVEEAWKVVDPIIRNIKLNKINLLGYKSGTWGPEESNNLFRNKNTWRYPCKNLINDGESCLL